MKVWTPLGRCLLALPLLLIVLTLLLPLQAYSGGEVNLREYISKEEVWVGETVTFGEGELPLTDVTVRWNFGDGSPEVTGWPVTHVYEKAGEYQVTAVITYRATGTVVPAIPTRIRVKATGNTAPQARATVTPQKTLAGLPITFDATASSDPDGLISRYQWNFGDGNMSTEAKTTHAYSRAGVYHIILTVTDNGQMDATTIVSVTVTALPKNITGGLDRAVPPSAGDPPALPPLVLVDMGVYDVERFPYSEYHMTLTPPFRGMAAGNRDWLVLDPTEYERITGTTVVLVERISVRNTSLLPRAHTSWGLATLVVNGLLVEMPVAVTVRGPARDISAEVWAIFHELDTYLLDQGERSALVWSPHYPNGADFALGLITEYVIENGYGGKISQRDFVIKIAELLMDRDQNGDQVVGFTDADRNLGIKISQ